MHVKNGGKLQKNSGVKGLKAPLMAIKYSSIQISEYKIVSVGHELFDQFVMAFITIQNTLSSFLTF